MYLPKYRTTLICFTQIIQHSAPLHCEEQNYPILRTELWPTWLVKCAVTKHHNPFIKQCNFFVYCSNIQTINEGVLLFCSTGAQWHLAHCVKMAQNWESRWRRCNVRDLKIFLALSKNFEKRLFNSSCLSVLPSVLMEKLGSKCMDFREIWYLVIFKQCVEKFRSVKFWQE